MQKYDQFTLDNGLRIIAQHMPSFRSVAAGVWVRAGSVDEDAQTNGYSHFIEHLLFKGTQRRSARDLAVEMDMLGGGINAFTSKEYTCFHGKVIGERLGDILDLLGDLVLNAKFDPDDIEKEKGVVLEEIAMVEDSPEEVAHNLIACAHFGDGPISRTILGPEENIEGASRESILAYKQRFYTPGNAVLAVAGSYDRDELLRLADKYFGGWQMGEAASRAEFEPAGKRLLYREKTIEQAHLCLGFDGVKQGEEGLYPLSVFNSLLGGGMSSRLFQVIREDMGLAYSVYSYPASYSDAGMMNIYAGTSPKNVQAVIDVIGKELRALLEGGIGPDEFEKAKAQIKGSFILGQESTTSRMNAIGRSALMLENVLTSDEILAKVEGVTIRGVLDVMEKIVSSPMSAALVGIGCEADYSRMKIV